MRLALFLVWTAVIVGATTLPWSDYVGHPHWDHVQWIPFLDYSSTPTDVALNILLFVPFGFLFMWAGYPSAKRSVSAVLMSAALSISVEFFQVFCHNRIPSATDVVTNVIGAAAGVFLCWRGDFLSREAKKLRQRSPS